MSASVNENLESYSFQAEVVQILDLMVHSLYSNKEIFLRELISNASDAIDRLRLEMLASSEIPEEEGPLQIVVSYDSDQGTISISDNGIGMSKQEVIDNLGTIAKSGTRDFLRALTGDQRKDANLIGEFGVGFYSAFIVADRVTVTTRRAGAGTGDAVRWESDAKGDYTLAPATRPDRGTTITLHVREDDKELLSGHRLRSIISKYSDHISVPILMPAEAAPAADADTGTDTDTGDAEGGEGGEAVKFTTVNQASALWTRPQSEISEKDYVDFYRHITNDYADPLVHVHRKIEGRYEYTLLLFIPGHAPYDLWMTRWRHGIRLHVRRVFIMEDDGQLMPRYLRFVRGVLDSADLPLNVSRELLQSSQVVASIQNQAVKTILRLLKDTAEKEPGKYATFWKEFGAVLKEGIVEDYGNREAIARLLRFRSTAGSATEPDVSLADYVERMPEGQDKIYYLLTPTSDLASSSPYLEQFAKKGIEVLLLDQEVDSWMIGSLFDFDGKRLQSATQGDADLGELADSDEQEAKEKADADFAALTAKLKEALDGKAWEVRVSRRLTTSPACIVSGGPEFSFNLPGHRESGSLPAQPVLEINPQHPLVTRLRANPDDPRFADWARVLFNQAVLMLGARVEHPAEFVTQLNDLLVSLAGDAPQPD
ncbi:MAG TPA: molecular chaperone HtpG [Streptosporangiaceae bacterium]|nr:molecular chaperone HtpG [Streptosporangiaceae bacterium]